MSTIFLFFTARISTKKGLLQVTTKLYSLKNTHIYIYIVEYYVKYIENIIKNYFTNDTIKSTI